MVIKWATMTKEQKQIAGFAAFCVFAVFYGGYIMGVKPALDKTDKARKSLAEAELELNKMSRTVKLERTKKAETVAVTDKLKGASSEHLPNIDDPLSWATELLGRVSRSSEIPLGGISSKSFGANLTDKSNFGTYSVGVAIKCSFFDALKFVAALKEANPYTVIADFTIRDGSEDEVHTIQLSIEWPMWRSQDLEMKLDS